MNTAPSIERNTTPATVKNAPEYLQLTALDELVGAYKSIDAEYRQDNPEATDADIQANRQQVLGQLLEERGIRDGDSDAEHAEYEFARSIYENAAAHDQNSWAALSDDEDSKRPRDAALNRVIDRYYQASSPTESINDRDDNSDDTRTSSVVGDTFQVPESPSEGANGETQPDQSAPRNTAARTEHALTPAEFDNAHEIMHGLFDEYAKKIATRSKKSIESTKTGADIENTGAMLSEYMAGIASELYFELEATGLPHDEIVAQIDAFIAESTEETLQKVEAHRMAEYNNSRPYMKKVYDKWADWSDDKRLKGGRGKKMAAMAAGGAVIGFALAPLVGAVGAGVVTGAVAVAGTRSIGRQLAGGFLKKRDKRFAQAQTDEMRRDLNAAYQANTAQAAEPAPANTENPYVASRNIELVEFLNQRSHEYRVRNRNRVLAGTAIAMTVGLLSSTAANALTDVDWSFGKLHDVDWKNPFGGSDADSHDASSDSDHNYDRDGDGIRNKYDATPDGPDGESFDRDGDGVRNWMDADPDNADVTDAADGRLELSSAAMNVKPGEGGFQTLKEMNVPERKWEAIWEQVGAKLADEGKTYRMADGRWGWDHTMRLSNRDLRVFEAVAARHNVTL